jgi:DNA-binding CsgD family transcriptional regulator
MARVRSRDYEEILDVVAEVAVGTVDEPIPERALMGIRRLIPCDVVSYFEGAPWDRARRRVWSTGDIGSWTDEERLIHDRFRFQLPLLPSPATVGHALRITDFMSQRAYRNLDLYALVHRRHQIEYSMDYWMRSPDGLIRGVSLDASRRDFSERDRAVLEITGRHLQQILGRRDPRPPRAPAQFGLTDRQAEVLAWVARGLTNTEIAAALSLSPHTVRKHLENAFSRLRVHSRGRAVALVYPG